MAKTLALVLFGLAAVSALPLDHVVKNLAGDGPRFQYVQRPDGTAHLADMWVKISDLQEVARYDPDRQNIYHLFTRRNPTVSQPILFGVNSLLDLTNFNPGRRTIVLCHGWLGDALNNHNRILVPAYLAAEDVNVIVVDWNAGAGTINYIAAVENTLKSGVSVARFITWLNQASGSAARLFALAGHSLGGHQVGIIGRNLGGQVPYITALDPAFPGWTSNENRFDANDGVYTEAIHTNAGVAGYLTPLAHVDFYPNGGNAMPGCPNSDCDHAIVNNYFAESLVSGGFTGQRCATYLNAMQDICALPGTLRMGGLTPKTGSTGIYRLVTNSNSPFSQG